jgi:hypothetical protein
MLQHFAPVMGLKQALEGAGSISGPPFKKARSAFELGIASVFRTRLYKVQNAPFYKVQNAPFKREGLISAEESHAVARAHATATAVGTSPSVPAS